MTNNLLNSINPAEIFQNLRYMNTLGKNKDQVQTTLFYLKFWDKICTKLIISSLQKSKLNVSYLKEQIVEYKSVLYYDFSRAVLLQYGNPWQCLIYRAWHSSMWCDAPSFSLAVTCFIFSSFLMHENHSKGYQLISAEVHYKSHIS